MYGSKWGGSLFRAHDKRTGEILAELNLGQRQTGVPMTYAVNGQRWLQPVLRVRRDSWSRSQSQALEPPRIFNLTGFAPQLMLCGALLNFVLP